MTSFNNLLRQHIDSQFWRTNLLPLLTGCIIGPLLGLLIVEESYLYAIALLLAVPVTIGLNRYPLTAFMVWVIFLPIVPPADYARYLYWIFHRSLIPLALIINLVSRMLQLKKHPPFKPGLPDISMGLYLIFAIFSVLFNSDSLVSQTHLQIYEIYDRTFVAFCAYWLVRLTQPNDNDMARIFPIMLFMLLFESIIGLVLWFDPSAITIWSGGRNNLIGLRGVGTFGGPGPYAAALMVFSLFVMQYAITKATGYKRLLYLTAVMLGLVCILLSFSRGSWLAAIIVVAILWYLYPYVVNRMIGFMLILMTVLLSTVLQGELQYVFERLSNNRSAESRLVLANAGQQMFLERPIFGWGFGTYDTHDWKFITRVGDAVPTQFEIKDGTSHNTYLTMLAETGLIGTLFYMYPFIWWGIFFLRIMFHFPKDEPTDKYLNWRFLIMLWANIMFIFMTGQFIDLRFFWFIFGELFFTLGLIANLTEHYWQKRLEVA